MNKFNKINCIYEFKTPNGFLPVGFEHKSIPIIFSHINENTELHKNSIIRTTKTGKFELVDNITEFTSIINFKKLDFNYKLICELTEEEIRNDLNILFIGSTRSEVILSYIETLDVTDILSKKTINLIKNHKNFKIVFIDEKEGGFYHSDLFFNKLYELFNHIGLTNPTQLIYITNSVSVNDEYNNFLKINNISNFMKASTIDFYILSDAGFNINNYIESTFSKYIPHLDRNFLYSIPNVNELNIKRSKYFLNLNRNSTRLHRPKLVLELIKRKLFDKGLVSLLKSDEFDKFCDIRDNNEYKNLIYDKYPFVVDYEDADTVAQLHNYLTKKDMWMNSYFSIVSETSVNDNFCFITEKTVRPIIYYHPFIIWGNPHTLKRLRELGFETFPEFFNEQYDEIIDSNERLDCILKSIENLCNKSIDELHAMYLSVIPKLIKNQELLIKFYDDNKLYTNLINILK
jgi:hypothetical protein